MKDILVKKTRAFSAQTETPIAVEQINKRQPKPNKSLNTTQSRSKAIENIHANHRSRVKDKFYENGLGTFADHEVLELLLFFSIPQADTNPTAHKLIKKFGSLKNVFDASIDNLLTIDGIGKNSALLIKLVPEIMHKYNLNSIKKRQSLENQIIAKEFISQIFKGVPNEQFYVVCLNAKSEVIDMKEMSKGTPNKVDVEIRKLTDYIIKHDCDRIIIAHNHPHGDPTPSNDDINMTQRIFNSCVLNDIDILDHVIYSPTGTYSFAEDGLMTTIKNTILDLLRFQINNDQYKKFSTSIQKYIIKK